MAISSSSNRRLLVFQALFALFTLLMYRSLARGGVTSKLSPEQGDAGNDKDDGAPFSHTVDAAIFHLVNDSYTPFFSEYSLKTSIRSVMKHVPWVNGHVVVVTDAYDQVQTQFRLDEAATFGIKFVKVSFAAAERLSETSKFEAALQVAVNGGHVHPHGDVLILRSNRVFLQQVSVHSQASEVGRSLRGEGNWALRSPLESDLHLWLADDPKSPPLLLNVQSLASAFQEGAGLMSYPRHCQAARRCALMPSLQSMKVDVVSIKQNAYATLIDTARRLVLRRPDSVVLSCGLDTELHYRNEILRESAQDIQDARAAARAYIAQLNAGETVKLPGRRRPGIQETHPLSFILRDVLIPAVSTERISVAAAKYEVQVPNIDRNKRFYGEFDAIVRAFEKK